MFQLLLSANSSDWQTHTFGSENNYDCKMAHHIAGDNKIKHSLLKIEIPSPEDAIKTFYNYTSQLCISSTISDTLIYMLYKEIDKEYNFIIDGAFGEIFRRAFLVKLSLTGKDKILRRDPLIFYQALRAHKSDMFNDDVKKQLEQKSINQIDKTLKLFQDPADIGVENWLDNFLIITKVPNVSSLSQTVMDNSCSAYMPFIQPFKIRIRFAA